MPLENKERHHTGRIGWLRVRGFNGISRSARRAGCTCGRRKSDDRGNTGYVLGCAGHGADRRRRVAVWKICERGQSGTQTSTAGAWVLQGALPGP
jgi:hypothetical protein